MEETNIPKPPSQAQLQINTAVQRMRTFRAQGRYQDALAICLQIAHTHPQVWGAWADAAGNCVHLARWQDAIRYAETALARGGDDLVIYDALAHAHGKLGQWDEARRYGLQSLNMRDRLFGGTPAIPLPELGPLPPPPSAQTRGRNLIAFSLFGRNSKYCETAVLNVQEQPNIYPHWVCRFYVDDSVPAGVINRLRKGGVQIVPVDGPAAQWPGPMWRLLALDDPQAHRILFRDADSMISQREAHAVEQWLTSGKRFHMMRDNSAGTELMLAGLWGVVGGSLPPLQQLMERFMSAPLESQHFADQYFLRQYVWPYARTSLMQHDSVFGFMDAVPFPDGERPEGFCVGEAEGSAALAMKSNRLNGAEATWELYRVIGKPDNNQARAELICTYTDTVHSGVLKVHVPKRYLQWIQQGTARLRLLDESPAQLQVNAAVKHMKALQDQGRYEESLDCCLQIAHDHPNIATAWADAALNCAALGRWQDVIRYGQTALARGGNAFFVPYPALAHAHGALGHRDEARFYGLLSLNTLARQFNGEPVIPLNPGPMPPPPSAQTRECNVIAFSLFGRDSKYCETAVLNVQEQPVIYPHWVCRFYVDGSVPESVIARLRAGGAQIVRVEGPAAQWPGPMWRLLALDDPRAHRILFRDADSVISRREAAAVEQWVSSGKRFHMMRDWGSHTELMLAGLWGAVAGSLPPLDALMQRFMSVPLESRHFADQYFLRQYIWPYARASLMQHDSVFGFMDAAPFPDVKMPDKFHVGCAESVSASCATSNLPDGSEVTWGLYLIEKPDGGQTREKLVCSYPGTVKDGAVKAYIPMRYAQWLEQKTARMRLLGNKAAIP